MRCLEGFDSCTITTDFQCRAIVQGTYLFVTCGRSYIDLIVPHMSEYYSSARFIKLLMRVQRSSRARLGLKVYSRSHQSDAM